MRDRAAEQEPPPGSFPPELTLMWTYRQSDGELTHDGAFIGTGYSGRDQGRNAPAFEAWKDIGPLPHGRWHIGSAHSEPRLGPCVMELTAASGTGTFGRSAFFIHGDNARHDASHGCIILGPSIRERIAKSADRDLLVIP